MDTTLDPLHSPPSLSIREEVQQVLEKVTDQLEHQYSAHQELEKLRLKQEAMLLREKERQVCVCEHPLKMSLVPTSVSPDQPSQE